ncbi:hypothetical protein [Leptospira interrogans]|uniref:hypothetical protein n=1 Tax=Leptospira interrogans TaxID=173 RepID=UPI00188AA958|nr:hypothetical protein [Leptospira interrogans]MBF3368197.1 hypothetical protein [Leptospira interrogans serovar Pomona]
MKNKIFFFFITLLVWGVVWCSGWEIFVLIGKSIKKFGKITPKKKMNNKMVLKEFLKFIKKIKKNPERHLKK